jgi:hypothetical protein
MRYTLKVSKLAAAKGQLETTIRLFFSNGEPVSIHTLTAAAYGILRGITKKLGAGPMLLESAMLESVKPQYHREMVAKVKEAENFFKHADRGHDSVFDFDPSLSELMILDACAQYRKLGSEEPPLFVVYRLWTVGKDPKLFILSAETQSILPELSKAVERGRASFFAYALPFAAQIASLNVTASKPIEQRGHRIR